MFYKLELNPAFAVRKWSILAREEMYSYMFAADLELSFFDHIDAVQSFSRLKYELVPTKRQLSEKVRELGQSQISPVLEKRNRLDKFCFHVELVLLFISLALSDKGSCQELQKCNLI